MMRQYFLFLFTLIAVFSAVTLSAQDPRLAVQYMQDREFEKAAELFKILSEKQPGNTYYLNQYLECLMQMEDYNLAEQTLEREIKRRPNDMELYATYGGLLERMGKGDLAEKQYQKAIKNLPTDRVSIMKLGSSFTKANKYDLAIEVYEEGEKLFKDDRPFSYNLADLYRRKGEASPMIYHYLNSLERSPSSIKTIQNIFQRYLDEEGFKELQKQLFKRMQTDQDNVLYPEMLAWLFTQKKDFRNAIRQVKAIDQRINDDGQRVFNMGQTALYEKDYDNAIVAFNYIIEDKGRSSRYYIEAKKAVLATRRQKITDGFQYDVEDLKVLEKEYQDFLEEFGYSSLTAEIVKELAELQAFYMNDMESGIETLEELLKYRAIRRDVLAKAKLKLGDYYLMSGDRWEATLLYSQVDKDFGDEILGQEARFRNARLSYFVGDFEWAQSLFDILKASTSRFIANDAIDLSVFITDNLGLDTTAVPLGMYAEAEMLLFQNDIDGALALVQDLRTEFPKHKLEDDILYLEARVFEKRHLYEDAIKKYREIVDEYPEGIRADNALFAIGRLYEEQLKDYEKARAAYEELFIEYNNSTYSIDARKRYRILRGDNI